MTGVVTVRTTSRIEAPARLHLGFLDPDATLGRHFGSIGLAIDGLATIVSATPHHGLAVRGPGSERARGWVETVLRHYGLPHDLAVTIEQAIPAHVGLGSGTQLALATGMAVLQACERSVPAGELATLLGRGRRSGIGLNLFEHGGLIVDGGHGPATHHPPVLCRLAMPPAWRIVLVFDRTAEGLSGGAERDAFSALAPMARSLAAELCHVTLMGLLPAVVEQDFVAFSRHVAAVQAIIGDHFAPVQGGACTSPLVRRALRHAAESRGLVGAGQSSWGPTGFVFVESPPQAAELAAELGRTFAAEPALEFMVCGARNAGAVITRGSLPSGRRLASA